MIRKRAVFILLFLIQSVAGLEPLMAGAAPGILSVPLSNITSGFFSNIGSSVSFYGGISDSLAVANKTLLTNYSGHKDTETIEVPITAYSSSVDETDDTPFITASGSYTADGVAAANFLPFGTKFRIPKIFGDKVFVVEDRMHRSYNYRIDIWFPSKEEAIQFGYQFTEVEIL